MSRFRAIALVLRQRTSTWCVGDDVGVEQHVRRLHAHAHVLDADAMYFLCFVESYGCPFLAKAGFVHFFFMEKRVAVTPLPGGTITILPKEMRFPFFFSPTPTPQLNHNHHAGGN